MCTQTSNYQITMKNFSLGLIISLIFITLQAQTPDRALQQFLSRPQYRNANIGVFIKDLTNDSLLISYNTEKYLTPASIQKLLTTYCALSTLGSDHRFATELFYTGYIKDSVLHGDIIIKGHGDPTFGSRLFGDTLVIDNLAQTITNAGIHGIKGRIIADASVFGPDPVPHKWTWEDLGNYYGAAPSGLCMYDNTYTVIFQTGRPGTRAIITSIDPHIPGLTIRSYVHAARIRSDQSYIIGAPFSFERKVTGRLPAYRRAFRVKGSIPDPALLLAQQLYQRLTAEKILVNHEPISIYDPDSVTYNTGNMTILWRHYSPPLKQIISKTNEKSINLYAEELLLHLALRYKDTVTTSAGVSALYQCLWSMGVDTTGFDLYDGSGLSHYNSLTVKALAQFLEKVYHSPNFRIFLSTLPVAGINGTLKYFGRGTVLDGHFHCKSGSMRHVRNYAGYYISSGGRVILVVVITNNFRCRQSQVRHDIEQLLNQILSP